MSEKIERNFLKCVFPYYLQPQYCKYMQMPSEINNVKDEIMELEDVDEQPTLENTMKLKTLDNLHVRTVETTTLPSIKTNETTAQRESELKFQKGELFTYSNEILDKQQTELLAANYCNVVKKVKKDNITPENIGEIILCQIPGISSVSAIAIMKQFSSFPEFMKQLQNNPDCLNDIMYETKGKNRKINKTCIENIKRYLL